MPQANLMGRANFKGFGGDVGGGKGSGSVECASSPFEFPSSFSVLHTETWEWPDVHV